MQRFEEAVLSLDLLRFFLKSLAPPLTYDSRYRQHS